MAIAAGTSFVSQKKGEQLLAYARRVIPEHEDGFAKALSRRERETLRRLLLKLIAD